jgi:hypothetical protein
MSGLTHFFPLRREHYHDDRSSQMEHRVQRSPILQPENRFEIRDHNDELEMSYMEPNLQTPQSVDTSLNHATDGGRNESIRPARVSNFRQNSAANNTDVEGEADEMNLGSLRRLYGLNVGDGWDEGTSAEEMKHQILLGLRVGFCGAISTWSSWNSAMINLLRAGKIGEALVGYAIGIQLGVVCYRCK